MVIKPGDHVCDRDQPPLSIEEENIVSRFNDLYFQHWIKGGADTIKLSWMGYELLKCPLDLWIYQEILVRTRPDVVIETGTWCGGSALYLAAMLDLIGHGRVITIDAEAKPGRPEHPRIQYVHGSSTDPRIVAEVTQSVGAGRAMVILDSDHSAQHVIEELHAYSSLVHIGDYLIVEDTIVNGHPTWPNFGPGPMEAVDKFLSENDEFAIDKRCERFLMTLHPRGYLKRTKSKAL
jgi:cephalosporin hydroxylase